MVTPQETKQIDRARWPYTTLFDIMRPLAEIRTVGPDTPPKTALEIMSSQDLNQLPVVSDQSRGWCRLAGPRPQLSAHTGRPEGLSRSEIHNEIA